MVLEQIAMRKGDEFGKTYKTKAKATEALQHWIDTVLLVQFEAAINHTRDRLEARRQLIGDQILDLSSAGTLLKYDDKS
jgi:hypothetical protein